MIGTLSTDQDVRIAPVEKKSRYGRATLKSLWFLFIPAFVCMLPAVSMARIMVPTLTFVENEVGVKNPAEVKWALGKVDDILTGGDSVKTGYESKAEITTPTERIRLYQNTVVNVPRIIENGDARHIPLINLDQGAGIFRIRKSKERKTFKVKTKQLVLGVKGTTLSVATDGTVTIVEVYFGTVEVTDPTGTVESFTVLNRGERMTVVHETGFGTKEKFEPGNTWGEWFLEDTLTYGPTDEGHDYLSDGPIDYSLIFNTAHDFQFGSIEPNQWEVNCGSLCHTYVEIGANLSDVEAAWITELDREGAVGVVASMCGSCHRTGGGYSASMSHAISDDYAYGKESHGQKMWTANPPESTNIMISGLPYLVSGSEAGHFECSTCHSTHDDTARPFLRDDINVLCVRCHAERDFIAGIENFGLTAISGEWGVLDHTGIRNPGSHPVGSDVVAGRKAVTIGAQFKTPYVDMPGAWSPGSHLTEGSEGGVSCSTCHAVHGFEPDAQSSIAGTPWGPRPMYLTVHQELSFADEGQRPLPNGDAAFNALCNSCHGIMNNPSLSPIGDAWFDDTYNVHPGPTGKFSHPVNTYPSAYDTGVEQFPEGWPVGDPAMAGQNVSPVPICESCHVPHPMAALPGRADVISGAAAFILRAPITKSYAGTQICDACHDKEMADHHPVHRSYSTAGVPYLMNANAFTTDRLSCSTCHVGAHDWSQPGWAGLDPAWKPMDNGRNLVQSLDMFNPDTSKTCMDCHYFMDGDGTSIDPSMGTKQTVIVGEALEHYQVVDQGMGTHYIGLIHEDEEHWFGTPILNIFDSSSTWLDMTMGSEYETGVADGWSRFGGENVRGKRVLVCESCHELEPDRNSGFQHQLLSFYQDGLNGYAEYDGDEDGMDVHCLACHGVPTGSHPMTDTDLDGDYDHVDPNSKSVREEILGNATLGREMGEEGLSCDSCHQPHNANPDSYTKILDVPLKLKIDMWGELSVKLGIDGFKPGYSALVDGQTIFKESSGIPGTYTSPTPGILDHHVVCLQCHPK